MTFTFSGSISMTILYSSMVPGTVQNAGVLQSVHSTPQRQIMRMQNDFSSKGGHKTVIGVSPALRECQKTVTSINLPRAQTFFPSGHNHFCQRGVNRSCNVVWPVLTFSDMSTGYAASNFDQTSTIKYLLIHRVSIGLILCWRESYTSPLKGETIFVYKGT